MKTRDGQVMIASSQSAEVYADLKKVHGEVLELSGEQWNWPSVVGLSRPSLARILNLNYLYDRVLERTGVICEFGVHYGSSTAILTNLRAIKEPYNYSRRIFGFDTFDGFSGVTARDGKAISEGDFRLDKSYAELLERALFLHEQLAPMSNIKKFQLYKGDASETVKLWLSEHPYAIVAMAIFDMDIYKPTKAVLEALIPRLARGSILVFDELNCPHFPGETQAALEVLDFHKIKLRQSPYLPFTSYAVFGD